MKVILIAAVSADGYIAKTSNHPADWTSKEDKKLFVELTKKAGAMVMGRNTYETIGKALPGRLNIVYTSKPLDDPGVEATQEPPDELLNRLEKDGYDMLAVCGGRAVYDLFLKNNLIDELYITIEPKLFGSGISLAKTLSETELELIESKKLNDDTLNLHYKVVK
ncbi:MAG TPA: dihydrofolate reductase family protein [Candidatus Saccharimonadales bacterium]|nr:dihydrofolate reductase family protein [Candidatus Saccharimonadales bacterium]